MTDTQRRQLGEQEEEPVKRTVPEWIAFCRKQLEAMRSQTKEAT